jgi:hypothetical protein
MSDAHATHRTILLIGRSLYLAAIEAGLRAVPGVTVWRIECWSPLHVGDEPDAVIIDSPSAFGDVVTGTASTFPQATIIEVSPGDGSLGAVSVWRGKQHAIDTIQELVRLTL